MTPGDLAAGVGGSLLLSIGSAARADPAEPALDFVVNVARRMDGLIEVLHDPPADARRRLDSGSYLRTKSATSKMWVNSGGCQGNPECARMGS